MALSAAEAERRLLTFRVPTENQRRVWAYMEKTFSLAGYSYYSENYDQLIGKAVAGLNILNRRSTLSAIAGPLRPALENALKIAAQLPYQARSSRVPFRARNIAGVSEINVGRMVKYIAWARQEYDQPIEWHAEWCGYTETEMLSLFGLDVLLAVEIDAGNKVVLDILLQSIRGTHPIGIVSKTGLRALMRCKEPVAWQAVENLLLSADRAEGLRQAIIECADELNPVVFQRFVRLIIEHNLLRFSSVFRAFLMWFPGLIQEGKPASAEQVLLRMLEFMQDRDLEPSATFEDTYLRLWTDAFFDAEEALRRGWTLFGSPSVEVRRAVAEITNAIRLSSAGPLIEAILRDPDFRVCASGIEFVSGWSPGAFTASFQTQILSLAKIWPQKASPDIPLSRKDVWGVALRIASTDQLPFYFQNLHELSGDARFLLAHELNGVKDANLRKEMALKLAGDTASSVRELAFRSLSAFPINPPDAPGLEELLTRKAADLRTAVLTTLARQPDGPALESARRLASSTNSNQRQAGAELAEQLVKRGVSEAAELRPTKGPAPTVPAASASDLFGLLRHEEITFAPKPDPVRSQNLYTPGALAILKEFDDYLHSRRDEIVTSCSHGPQGNQVPIGDLTANSILPYGAYSMQFDNDLPFVLEVIEWYQPKLPKPSEESDDLVRALIISEYADGHRNQLPKPLAEAFNKHKFEPPRHLSATRGLLMCICRGLPLSPTVVLDMIANEISTWEDGYYEMLRIHSHEKEYSWRKREELRLLRDRLQSLAQAGTGFRDADWKRAFLLLRFIDEPAGSPGRAAVEALHDELHQKNDADPYWYNREVESRRKLNIPFREAVPFLFVDRAFELGFCTKSDVLDQVRFNLGKVTQHEKAMSPGTRAVVQELVDRIVEVEAQRGDLKGEASHYAGDLQGMIHLGHVVTILNSGVPLTRTPTYYTGGSLSRAQSFTRLLTYSRPAPGETTEVCSEAFRALNIKPERFVELAMLSPHWAAAIERALGWESFEDAVWWLHAHTKEEGWGVPPEIKALWAGAISERTPLSSTQLENGSCDPAWFHRFRAKIDDKLWKQLDKNAKFASSSSGHARAQLFARALSGEVSVAELKATIEAKRNPNAVRALGLVPLLPEREADIRDRYRFLQEFHAGSRQFGSARQATEKLAFEVAIENLAATAGYPDALRLTWALESSEVEDLKGDGLIVKSGDLEVRLFFDPLGQPTLEASKDGRSLKEIPAAAKKLPEIKVLADRRTQLKKQLARMRLALEQAMQRGDSFTADELRRLVEHPGLAPLLRNLVFLGESGVADFPDERGNVAGETGMLRIAHPYDLLQRGDWPEWQTRVFREERVQPLKQVFRELYVLTDSERAQSSLTRYGGHQVRGTQALAILSKRGWISRYEEGVSKTFHKLNLTARITLDNVGYSPADIEGATLQGLEFTRSNDWNPIPLSEIPPLVFSETVRDLDLIVSVASMIGVDPEASESTVEMRQRVVEQTARLLSLENVSFMPRHVKIEGKLAEYTVNLGSGTVHQRAKGELVIIAVRQPQRGRLFLPFVDDDPRTAEIVSKTILLARDDEIKDPSILGQIVGR